MSIVSLLGVSQITSPKEISSVLQQNRITSFFYEQSFNYKTWNHPISKYTAEIDFFKFPFFIFCEFWLTKLIQIGKQKKGFNQIACNALMACRSKLFLSTLLEKRNIPCVHRELISKSPSDILPEGIIIRPDCAYSGRGVKHITHAIPFSQYLDTVSSDLSSFVQNIIGKQDIVFVEEEYIQGDEYSCDVIISPYGRKVMRVCLKKIKWINGYPCPIAYVTVPLSREMESAILSWCNVLFDQDENLSFAHFDFIKKNDGVFYPIDFSARPGGGLNFLLKAASDSNLYADSICFALGKNNDLIYPKHFFAQFSVITEKSGILKDISINWPDKYKLVMNYRIGDKIAMRTLSSSSARIVTIISQVDSMATFLNLTEHIEDNINIILA